MSIVYIALGSNLQDRQENIDDAVFLLKSHPRIKINKISSIIKSKPEGGPPQDDFLNGAVEIETELSPQDLLSALKAIEKKLGRVRVVKNGPRIIDLDILFYEDKIVNLPRLKIPHPRLHKRNFVLRPLCEIAPGFMHPVLKKNIGELMSCASE